MKKIILMMVALTYALLANEAILSIDTGGHTAMIRDIVVTKSGDIISASNDKTIRVWDSKSGKEKRKILGEIGADNGEIFAIALSPDEKYLAVSGFLAKGHGVDDDKVGLIRLYDYQSGKLLTILKSHTDAVANLAFSPDGRYLASGSGDKTVKLWDMKSFSLLQTINFHTNDVYGVKFADNNTIISAGDDNRIALHDLNGKMIGKPYTHSEKLRYIATNGKTIASCGMGNEILLFDKKLNLQNKIKSETHPEGLAYSSDGRYLIAGTGTSPRNVNIYDSQNGYDRIASFDKHTNLTMAVAFLDNQTAISGGDNQEIYIWDSKTQTIKTKIVGAGQSVWSVGIDGDNIAWGNIWTETKGKSKFQKSFNLKSLSLNSVLVDGNFKRIDSNGLSHSKGGDYGYGDAVLNIASTNSSITKNSTNGYGHNCYGWYKEYIISGGSNGNLKIYDTKGVEVASLVGHTGEIWSIALDGDRLVSGSSDQTIKVWDLKHLRGGTTKQSISPLVTLFVGSDNEWVIWTPQGYFNASKNGAKYIGYHINQGSDKEAEFLDISRFRKDFYRPDIVIKAIDGEDISSFVVDIDKILQNRAGGLPPEVKILTSSRSVEQDEITIGVKVCDKGGGSENLSFYIDDKPVQYLSQTRAFREKKEMLGGCIVLEQKLAIPYGEHNISFNATNKSGDIGSNTDKIKITNKKAPISKPNLHILTLSISDYKDNSLDLKYPNNDADKIAQKLQIIGKPIFSNIYNYALKDAQVTQSSILKTIEDISSKIKSDDVFILYIAGHGVTSSKDGDYYFIPFDCKNGDDVNKYAINQAKFKEYIAQIKAVKSAIFIDTCQSGTMASKDLLDTSINRFGGNVGIAIIAGASSKQDAIDGYKEHGIFSYTVLDAMNNEKVYSFDDKLSINEIAEYTKYILPKLAKEQFNHEQKPTIYLNGDTTFAVGGVAK